MEKGDRRRVTLMNKGGPDREKGDSAGDKDASDVYEHKRRDAAKYKNAPGPKI